MTTTSPVRLYNTLSRSVETLHPLSPSQVKLYCCGPTVYNFAHVGNLRTYLFEDLLARTLRAAGYQLSHVMNITDVGHLVSDADSGEDKMLVAMRREGRKSAEIAEFYSNIFFEDCAKLNIIRPDVVCNATAHIPEMIALIQRLEKNGCTYVAGGNVYFDVHSISDYGKLARLDLSKLEAGARIEIDAHKKNPHDFVLWFTKSKFENQELQWESPWGRGYPGWHIECSAMSMKHLGEEFDIHCGGVDHISVHHTNEIAQSEGATGKPWVNIWMHGGFLVNENKEKMAKSAGGFIGMKDLIEKGIDPVAYRLMCLSAHYKMPLAFSWEILSGAAQTLEKLKRAVLVLKAEAQGSTAGGMSSAASEIRAKFFDCFFNDLNAPQALAVMWGALSEKSISAAERLALILDFDCILGLGAAGWREQVDEVPAQVRQLVSERDNARQAKDWKQSDLLRDQIKALGYTVVDFPDGGKARKLAS